MHPLAIKNLGDLLEELIEKYEGLLEENLSLRSEKEEFEDRISLLQDLLVESQEESVALQDQLDVILNEGL